MAPLSYTLRPATWDDADFVYLLRRAVYHDYVAQTWGQWDEDWQRNSFFVKFNPDKSQVICVAGRPIGDLELDLRPGCLFLGNIAILPEFQNRGIGTAIVRELIEDVRRNGMRLELQVLKVNCAARRFYERLGLTVVESNQTHDIMQLNPDRSHGRNARHKGL